MTTARASTTTRFVSLLYPNNSVAQILIMSVNALCGLLICQASQLYYDASTGIYYYYDAESGRYQFHSKIEVPAAQTGAEQDKCTSEKKGRWSKKVVKKTSQQADKVQNWIHPDTFYILVFLFL